MGEHPDYHPLKNGFDHYYGRMHNFHRGQKGAIFRGGSTSVDSVYYQDVHQLITKEAKEFMRNAKSSETPFFLYLSHYLVHGPWEPNKEFATNEQWEIREKVKGDIHHKVYPAMLRELDWHVGEVLQQLENLGIAENTVVFFTSDNGPWLTADSVRSAGSAYPLRGSKFNTFEGGHRVPAIIRYPNKIKPGTISDELVSSMDILPTIAHIAGAEMPTSRKIDGKNLWPLLLNQSGANTSHEVLYGYQGKNLQTIRKGKWKLHLPRTPQSVPFYAGKAWGRGTIDSLVHPMLFNLENDKQEQVDLSDKFPEVVEQLMVEAEKARQELGDWGVVGNDEHHLNGFEGDIHAIPNRTRYN